MTSINPMNRATIKAPTLENNDKNIDQGFSTKLKSAIKEVNHLQNAADDSAEHVVKGSMGIHEGMLKMQEADISLRLFMQVRAKVMAAYQEIMRMQV